MKKRKEKEIQEAELKAGIQDMSFSQKLEYFWMYYKWVLGIVIAVIAALLIANSMYRSSRIKTVLYIAAVNAPIENTEYEIQHIKEELGITEDKYKEVILNNNYTADEDSGELDYYSQTALVTYVQAGQIDVFAAPKAAADQFAEDGFYMDLKEVLGDDYEALSEYVYGNCLDISETDAADMYGIEEPVYIGVCASSKHADYAKKYILSIFNEE